MPYQVKSGGRSLGNVKTKSKKRINKLLANQYRKENRISVLKLAGKKRRKK